VRGGRRKLTKFREKRMKDKKTGNKLRNVSSLLKQEIKLLKREEKKRK
jgi:hypothetical protein